MSLKVGGAERIDDGEVEGLVGALDALRQRSPGLDLDVASADLVTSEALRSTVSRLREDLVEGPGVSALTGFPVQRFNTEELRAIWWLLSIAIGTPVPQSWRGDVIGDVRDLGTGISGKSGRGYTSNVELGFHSDVADCSGLFFLQVARSGGTSRFASSVAIHDELARRRPELLEVLYQPFTVSARQIEAVNELCALAREPQFSVERHFEPGAMVFCNNHTTFHLRTAFEDWPEPARRRHLLRIWLALPNSRPLPASFAPFFGDTAAGAVRGGYHSRDGRVRYGTG